MESLKTNRVLNNFFSFEKRLIKIRAQGMENSF